MSTDRRTFFKTAGLATAGLAAGLHGDLLAGVNASAAPRGSRKPPIAPDMYPNPTKISRATPQDHGEALINPGMGWVTYFYSNLYQNYGSQLAASDTVRYFPGMNTVFLRIPWAFVEPEEGKFVWEILDTPAQRWVDEGGQVAICITATENWLESGTPRWVVAAGACASHTALTDSGRQDFTRMMLCISDD